MYSRPQPVTIAIISPALLSLIFLYGHASNTLESIQKAGKASFVRLGDPQEVSQSFHGLQL